MASAPPSIARERDLRGRWLFGVLLTVGVGLRVWQVLENAPLWLDELALTNGLLRGSFAGLFDGPTDFGQVAPPGFLALSWLLAHGFPESELALRLPSFLLACASLVLTWLAGRELVGERYAWLPVGMVALAGPLTFMAGQLKPYAADAFFAPLLLLCVLRYDRLGTNRAFLALLFAAACAPFFSLGSVFVLGGVAAFMATRVPWRSIAWRPLILLSAVIGASVLVTVTTTERLVSPTAHALMDEYWAGAFPVVPPRTVADYLWPVRTLGAFLWSVMGIRGVRIVCLGIAAGAVIAWRRRPAMAWLLVVPLLAAFGASVIREFPLGARLLHWAVPILAVLLTIAVAACANLIGRRWPAAAPLPALLMLAAPAVNVWLSPPPVVRDDVRPVLDALNTRARPGDVLYLNWGAWHTWERYGNRVATLGTVVRGGCPRDYPRGYLRELDRFRGQPRLWVLFGRMQFEEEHRLLLDYLHTIGVRSDSLIVEATERHYTPRVDLHLFDLSDPSRLRRADAETFPIEPSLVRAMTGCRMIDGMLVRGNGSRVVRLF